MESIPTNQCPSTGYGQHADYVFGWKGNALQKAMDARCYGYDCTQLKTQTNTVANECSMKAIVDEQIDGWLTELPGGREVTWS